MLFQLTLKVLLSLRYLSIFFFFWSSVSDSLLSLISFSSLLGIFPFLLIGRSCLPILGDLFLLASVLWCSDLLVCLHVVDFCGRSYYVGLSGAVRLISLSGSFRVALSSICWVSLVVHGLFLMVAPFRWALPSSRLTGSHSFVLHVVIQMLVNKEILPDNQIYSRTPYCISNLIHNLRKINKCEERL
ncbi:hypothetical protein HJG60_009996 [Phyllostomus discolor]|uniref:Uncharacterized protein n=1 Tax=Phyllostomus discolor TaxID=89673 RepID=A0A833YFV2_9CHIR|nr:hypothetical protein HJG60_009996 [Phyllostomus discolor]